MRSNSRPVDVLVLMVDHPVDPSEPLCVSEDIEQLMECAVAKDLGESMTPLREIGVVVPIIGGDELHIEKTELL